MLLNARPSQRPRNGEGWSKAGSGDEGEVKRAIPDLYVVEMFTSNLISPRHLSSDFLNEVELFYSAGNSVPANDLKNLIVRGYFL